MACGFSAYGRASGFDPNMLVGTNPALFASVDGAERYIYSLYWSVTTLAGNEWNVSGRVCVCACCVYGCVVAHVCVRPGLGPPHPQTGALPHPPKRTRAPRRHSSPLPPPPPHHDPPNSRRTLRMWTT